MNDEHSSYTPEEMAAHIAEHHKGFAPMVLAVEPWVIVMVERLMEEEEAIDLAPDIHGSALFAFSHDSAEPVVIYNGNDEGVEGGVNIVVAHNNNEPLQTRILAIIDEMTDKAEARFQEDLDSVLKSIINPDS